MPDFLPINQKDMENRGWDAPDFVLITGDAYVDHPSFGAAVISRVLEDRGYRVAVLAQPDWQTCEPYKTFGRPLLGFLVTAGNIDSMVAHYSVSKKRRPDDYYSPGKKAGFRPDRAVIVYCNRIREAYGDIAVIVGGIEGSLRRFAHYDYWDDSVRKSILFDSAADILVYGMGETQITKIAQLLSVGVDIKNISGIAGTCVVKNEKPKGNYVLCPSFEEVKEDKRKYAQATKIQMDECDAIRGKTVIQPHGKKYLIQYPPAKPLTTEQLDHVYELPYVGYDHPVYAKQGRVPAIREVEFSIASVRGCFGGCNFCSLSFHQGRMISARSHASILAQAEGFTKNPRFKGYISDVGGPTANFRIPSCTQQKKAGMCKNKNCLAPQKCKNLVVDHSDYTKLLENLHGIEGIKKVFIRSGIRFDYLMYDKDDKFFYELCRHHISGQLKVAPEHCSDNVLYYMGKPSFQIYKRFLEKYKKINEKLGKKQYVVPYLMSSHPGSTLKDAIALALYLKETGHDPLQVQDFYPTPGTVSTCMFYTGIDPRTGKDVYVPKTRREKQMQRALLQFRNPKNRKLVIEALKEAGRTDLIGYGKDALVAPEKIKDGKRPYQPAKKTKARPDRKKTKKG